MAATALEAAQLEAELWARATVPGAKAGAAYGRISNLANEAITLDALTSGVAGMIEIHETVMDGGMMRMRSRMPLEIAPGQSLVLEPGGLHIMLMNLTGSLEANSSFELVLEFGDVGNVVTDVRVGAIGQMEMPE
jgi:copper(I)-binding protein